jgi:hypothetical protein
VAQPTRLAADVHGRRIFGRVRLSGPCPRQKLLLGSSATKRSIVNIMIKQSKEKIEQVPRHKAAVRYIVEQDDYVAYKTLAEARRGRSGCLVMQGDFGGTIYCTCPVQQIKCSLKHIKQLLTIIDTVYWSDPRGARIYFEDRRSGEGIVGGMGGGIVLDDIWVHPKIVECGLATTIWAVLKSKTPKPAFLIVPKSRNEMKVNYPKYAHLAGWYTRAEERKDGWHAEYADGWGRKVEFSAKNRDQALSGCLRLAKAVQRTIVRTKQNPAAVH